MRDTAIGALAAAAAGEGIGGAGIGGAGIGGPVDLAAQTLAVTAWVRPR